MFRGPSGLEQAQLNTGNLRGQALYQHIANRRGSLFGLAASNSISKAVAEILHLVPEEVTQPSEQPTARELEPENPRPIESEPPVKAAFAECERSRDGPAGL